MLMEVLKWILAFIGHIGLCCAAFNRIHASSFPRRPRKITEKLLAVLAVVPPIMFLWNTLRTANIQMSDFLPRVPWIGYYLQICILVALFLICRWIFRRFTASFPEAIISRGTQRFDIRQELRRPLLTGAKARVCGLIPGNQILQLSVDRWDFMLPNLPASLDGLKIAQLSDTHFTGMILPEYFQSIVDKTNEFDPDLVFITGDIIDEANCLDWILSVFGSLRSKHGCFYVLGNHDCRILDENEIHDRMTRAGMTWVGDGRWHDRKIHDATLRLAGNSQPWYLHSRNLPPEDDASADLKILLTHSPDQYRWAVEREFDLMFAGHTHGGQVRLPIIGPIVAPSRYGTKYSAGNFQFGKTLVHVSRGISGDEPIRIDCPPELGLFTLKRTRDN